jgi:ABC-type dipeptide/oligopeptide/nickel transport system ATPase component
MVPHPFARPDGCPFHTRCDQFIGAVCTDVHPILGDVGGGHLVRCHHYVPAAASAQAQERADAGSHADA